MAFLGLSARIPRSKRIIHYITAAITMMAAIAYFTMGSNLEYAAIPVEFQRSNPKVAGVFREIFYVRYIDRAITTPESPRAHLGHRHSLTPPASFDGPLVDSRSPMANNSLVHLLR